MENFVVDEKRATLLEEARQLGLELTKTRSTRMVRRFIDRELSRLRSLAKTEKLEKVGREKEELKGFKQMALF